MRELAHEHTQVKKSGNVIRPNVDVEEDSWESPVDDERAQDQELSQVLMFVGKFAHVIVLLKS
jgi:hypothetical protein